MQPSLLNNPPQKVKNILIRHSCSKEVKPKASFESPERFHLLRCAPKYYNTLSLEVTKENHLQSKIKRIKKLKNFKGHCKQILPAKLWLNLLANTRKEIEELPQITTIQSDTQPSLISSARFILWKVKFLPNLTRTFLPGRSSKSNEIQEDDCDCALLIKKSFLRYLGNMRKIKFLEMFPNKADNEEEKWMREKLDGMSQCLNRLEKLALTLSFRNLNIEEELQKNKNLLSHLTSLTLSSGMKFDKELVVVLEICKNLKFLSINLSWDVKTSKFLEFLTSIQTLPHLLGLKFDFPKDFKDCWTSFKPQTSLRFLKLTIDVPDLVKTGFFGPRLDDPMGHWEDIMELDQLEFVTLFKSKDDVTFFRGFVTEVLKKVRKLKSFKCSVSLVFTGKDSSVTGKPFLVEEISHLYESLQRFEYNVSNKYPDEIQLEFDLKKMQFFRNLEEFKLDGDGLWLQPNFKEILSLLEENQGLPMLKLSLELISPSGLNWLKDTLEKIKEINCPNKNLKIELELKFKMDEDELRLLDKLCQAVKSVGFIKGVMVRFLFLAEFFVLAISLEGLKGVMRKYCAVRNLVVRFCYHHLRI